MLSLIKETLSGYFMEEGEIATLLLKHQEMAPERQRNPFKNHDPSEENEFLVCL